MNMHDWAKEKDDLVEVIYATMDGNVYFLDLVTGEQTRDPMYIGWTFKGAGALDPRGYPILYLGAGYNSNLGIAHAFIINLVDCTVMYEFGGEDAFSLRGTVGFFDSSPLVDAETDTLIWPGENGVIYMIHLNSAWDEKTGTLTLAPGNVVKWHYKGLRSASNSYEKYWLGIEDSFAAYEGYLFATDNGGHLMCLDLNTLELVWVQDTLDDSNSTPILSNENGHLYLYTSTSFRLGWRSSTTATVPIWKIDAETGEKLWETPFECYTMDGVSGGVHRHGEVDAVVVDHFARDCAVLVGNLLRDGRRGDGVVLDGAAGVRLVDAPDGRGEGWSGCHLGFLRLCVGVGGFWLNLDGEREV
jgi:outer membrane protein assembly factor BamB